MSDWEERSDVNVRVQARVPEVLRDEFSDACDANDTTQTDVLRECMADYVREHRSAVTVDDLPDDDRLQKAYIHLRKVMDPDKKKIPWDAALPSLAQAVQLPKESVRRTIIQPLSRRDWLTVYQGTIYIHGMEDPVDVCQHVDHEGPTDETVRRRSKNTGQVFTTCLEHDPLEQDWYPGSYERIDDE